MKAQLLSGQSISHEMRHTLKEKISAHLSNIRRPPCLAVILVGEDPASHIYVQRKHEACQQIGISSLNFTLPESTSQPELLELIRQLNEDKQVDGILVQVPLPSHINADVIVESILPQKDMDGFHPYNIGRLAQRRPAIRPCTPFGIIKLLEYYQIPIRGQHAVVVGASNIVGRPVSLEFLLAGATVTTCHRFTRNLQYYVHSADLLVVATGHREIVKPEWIPEHCVVVDVGIHRLENGKLCGDLDFETLQNRVRYITPVPGGVGPMTVTMLLWNTVESWLSTITKSHI